MPNGNLRRACFRVTLMAYLLLFSSSCTWTTVTPIGTILAAPDKYYGRTVTLAGDVTSALNAIIIRTYMLKDSTGEIAVIARDAVPKVGKKHRVRGKVTQALAIGERSLLVIRELPR